MLRLCLSCRFLVQSTVYPTPPVLVFSRPFPFRRTPKIVARIYVSANVLSESLRTPVTPTTGYDFCEMRPKNLQHTYYRQILLYTYFRHFVQTAPGILLPRLPQISQYVVTHVCRQYFKLISGYINIVYISHPFSLLPRAQLNRHIRITFFIAGMSLQTTGARQIRQGKHIWTCAFGLQIYCYLRRSITLIHLGIFIENGFHRAVFYQVVYQVCLHLLRLTHGNRFLLPA